MPRPRKRIIGPSVLLFAVLLAMLPWAAGQLIASKVQRQFELLDQHPALSVAASEWKTGYAQSEGYVTVIERVGCGVRACSETRVDFAASHIGFDPLHLGRVVAQADLNGLLQYKLKPAVAPFIMVAEVGLFGRSRMQVSMSPSWHELQAERADAIAFSGFVSNFSAQNYAQNWQGDLNASFTVFTESASAEQKERMGQVMQSLGSDSGVHTEQVGSVIVRVIALMKELSVVITVWQGKELAWKPEINAAPPVATKTLLARRMIKSEQTKPLMLELTPDMLVTTADESLPQIALNLPSFEAWHGHMPMPVVAQRIDNVTYETEPDLDVWQLNMQWSGRKVTLNGLAIWNDQ